MWPKQVDRYGAELALLEWAARLVCSRCGSRDIDFVVSGARLGTDLAGVPRDGRRLPSARRLLAEEYPEVPCRPTLRADGHITLGEALTGECGRGEMAGEPLHHLDRLAGEELPDQFEVVARRIHGPQDRTRWLPIALPSSAGSGARGRCMGTLARPISFAAMIGRGRR
jgi:hypothetical protein